MLGKFTILAVAMAVAVPANAVSVISNQTGAPDPGVPAGFTTVIDFDNASAAGIVNTTTGTVITAAGATGGVRAIPAGNSETNVYQSVSGNATSTFNFGGLLGPDLVLTSLSLYWGSIDLYNTLQFLRADGSAFMGSTFTGANFPPANGNQPADVTNRRITFGFTRADAVTQVRFASGSNAFEFDDIGITAAVPEPASWAMLIVGFGLVGATLRRRHASTQSVLA